MFLTRDQALSLWNESTESKILDYQRIYPRDPPCLLLDVKEEEDGFVLKILKEMGILDHLICLLRNLYAGQEAIVRLDMEQQTGSKEEKEFVKAVYCHPVYLTSMQSTS